MKAGQTQIVQSLGREQFTISCELSRSVDERGYRPAYIIDMGVRMIQVQLNNRPPRKRLGFKTPAQVFR